MIYFVIDLDFRIHSTAKKSGLSVVHIFTKHDSCFLANIYIVSATPKCRSYIKTGDRLCGKYEYQFFLGKSIILKGQMQVIFDG